MKIRPVGGQLLHTDRQTDRHDKATHLFSQFRAEKCVEWMTVMPRELKQPTVRWA
jgi:hypothetical protein